MLFLHMQGSLGIESWKSTEGLKMFWNIFLVKGFDFCSNL